MSTSLSFTAIYEQVENGWVQARLDELPAVITVAPTLEAAKEQIVDALREYLLSLGGPSGATAPGAVERAHLDIVIQAA